MTFGQTPWGQWIAKNVPCRLARGDTLVMGTLLMWWHPLV